MRNDNLKLYVRLRRELTAEKAAVESKLKQINEALGEVPLPSLSAVQGATGHGISDYSRLKIGRDYGAGTTQVEGARRGRRPAGGGQSLREHVIAVLQSGPMTKEEVLKGVQSRGYTFATKNPLNSLGVVLYGTNPRLNRVDGMFSLSGGAGNQRNGRRGGRRRMSAAGKARLAEAARKRWAAAKRAGRSRL